MNLAQRTELLGEWINEAKAKMGSDIMRLVNAARFDVLYGPIETGEEPDGDGWKYPGWESALDAIANKIDEVISGPIWVDTDCGSWTDSEPEGYWEETGETDEDGDNIREWIEPHWDSICKFHESDLRHALIGILADYV